METELTSVGEREEADAAFVRAGVFRTLVQTMDEDASLDAAIVRLMQNKVLTQRLPRQTIQRTLGTWKRLLTELGVGTKTRHHDVVTESDDESHEPAAN